MGELPSGDVRVGLSGWRYRDWRGRFYPSGLAQRRELAYLASRFDTVEINGSFYSLQRPASYQRWAAGVPDDFVFAVKGGRYITHFRRLAFVETALANFFASGLLALGPKLGPVLWQLPPGLRFEPDRLEAFLAQLPPTTVDAARLARGHDARLEGRVWTTADADRPLRHALEVRDESFRDRALPPLLERYGVALVVADTAGRWPLLFDITADFVYVRLHGDVELYSSGYGDAALDAWAGRVRDWAASGLDVYVYFDNDVDAHAPFDAAGLARRLGVGPAAGPAHSGVT
ncbi:MAG TPA: DUF72 domain-containing protein [Kineosporiaceae bacterium]|nr:DUF72 domain-containing protein [Kineosporiaceae bacterium]